MDNIERNLPIGTVVLQKKRKKRVMIISYLVFATNKDGKKVLYDYGACYYPEGAMDTKNAVGFNQDDIEKVVFMGLDDDSEYKELKQALDKYGSDMKKEFKTILDSENAKQGEE